MRSDYTPVEARAIKLASLWFLTCVLSFLLGGAFIYFLLS